VENKTERGNRKEIRKITAEEESVACEVGIHLYLPVPLSTNWEDYLHVADCTIRPLFKSFPLVASSYFNPNDFTR